MGVPLFAFLIRLLNFLAVIDFMPFYICITFQMMCPSLTEIFRYENPWTFIVSHGHMAYDPEVAFLQKPCRLGVSGTWRSCCRIFCCQPCWLCGAHHKKVGGHQGHLLAPSPVTLSPANVYKVDLGAIENSTIPCSLLSEIMIDL